VQGDSATRAFSRLKAAIETPAPLPASSAQRVRPSRRGPDWSRHDGRAHCSKTVRTVHVAQKSTSACTRSFRRLRSSGSITIWARPFQNICLRFANVPRADLEPPHRERASRWPDRRKDAASSTRKPGSSGT
jgi:hypothetical protein